MPCTDGIRRDVSLEAGRDQIECRLHNANVRFDAADEHAKTADRFPPIKNLATLASAETQLAWHVSQMLPQNGRYEAKLLGILFRGGHRDTQCASRVHEPADVPNDSGLIGNHGQQFFLRVDDQQGRVLPVHQFRASQRRFVGSFGGRRIHGDKVTPGCVSYNGRQYRWVRQIHSI